MAASVEKIKAIRSFQERMHECCKIINQESREIYGEFSVSTENHLLLCIEHAPKFKLPVKSVFRIVMGIV
jgi:hypothetical protein